ncbi:MAG: ATP-dependent DNA helicase RecG [Cyclobacteriaceae bacterium]|nr:MAG: ATP-dependent DNA helicase RecG [Cyclobacteriaceae bacterium]
MKGFFDTGIEFLKGVGPNKADLINKELEIFNFGDLIQFYPFRYEDRTRFYRISEINERLPNIQVRGKIGKIETLGTGSRKRLVASLYDDTGSIELVWFKGIKWVSRKLKTGVAYAVFGKPTRYGGKNNIAHPEIEVYTAAHEKQGFLQPVYHTTEKLKRGYLDSRAIAKLQKQLLEAAKSRIVESLPPHLMNDLGLIPKAEALWHIHFPSDSKKLNQAQLRLKFEELFYVQLRLLKLKLARIERFRGKVFRETALIKQFYHQHLPFELTGAQKRVIREIYSDMKSGKQMNRLLQGDVGSGKTIVAFICVLAVVGAGAQAALMAPTEILAEQHYRGLKIFAGKMDVEIGILTGSTKQSQRKELHQKLQNGSLRLLVGTHALLEDQVQFNSLGLAVIDEQHRFGVAQRAKLWKKNKDFFPHVLVMTATPIPRTLAMTLYGDLDVSVIDELPPGRKPIETVHRYDQNRLKVFGFIKRQLSAGRQIYFVYPLIEESAKMDLKHLEDGYESIKRAFPEIPVSIVHGKMKSKDKDYEMQRFVKGETRIMVATTVIEVGVNVPNATVMVIENSERFGLAQLHQLRGRVGRGADQSYCILMTDVKISKEGRVRIQTMVRTNNGFEIADVDLKLRGPGDLMGTQQSGVLDLMIADLSKDGKLLKVAREKAAQILETDPELKSVENVNVRRQVAQQKKSSMNWSRIS